MRTAIQLTAVTMVLAAMSANGARVIGSQAPDPSDIAEGMSLYLRKGDCQTCHGWAADGRKMDSQMPDSPSLRETQARPRQADHDDQVWTARERGCRPSTSSRTPTAGATA